MQMIELLTSSKDSSLDLINGKDASMAPQGRRTPPSSYLYDIASIIINLQLTIDDGCSGRRTTITPN
jgi:hypothetical protein